MCSSDLETKHRHDGQYDFLGDLNELDPDRDPDAADNQMRHIGHQHGREDRIDQRTVLDHHQGAGADAVDHEGAVQEGGGNVAWEAGRDCWDQVGTDNGTI